VLFVTVFTFKNLTLTIRNILTQELKCVAQNYAWGKLGSEALVARLRAEQHSEEVIDETMPYAELWLGTHPNGMSNVIIPHEDGSLSSVALINYVQKNPELHLGVTGVTEMSDDYDLTFLFKVLSIEKVLSIQAHPDKYLAAQLHKKKPHMYKDPNHKPEMAIALTDDFEALCGFRPIYDIVSNLLDYPEFTDLIGSIRHDLLKCVLDTKCSQHNRNTLKRLFHVYMTANHDHLQTNISKISERLSEKANPTALDLLILKLIDQFPGDPGIFAPIIFNHMKLSAGQAFYISANEPHAYIQGDILECMACSDNVVRAGLTPKPKDVDTLIKMLSYNCSMPEITKGKKIDGFCTLYVPPVEDFAIEMIDIKPGQEYILKDVISPSILLTLHGSGEITQGEVQSLPVSFGKAAFMSANTTATIFAHADGQGLRIVRALSNVHLE
jgi:mannose-6-phosphate isomerase